MSNPSQTSTVDAPQPDLSSGRWSAERTRVLWLYAITFIVQGSISLVQMGFPFFAQRLWEWSELDNLLLSVVMGAVYPAGAMLAAPLSRRLGAVASVRLLWGLLALLLTVGWLGLDVRWLVCVAIVLVIFVLAGMWPLVESLLTARCPQGGLNVRVSRFNLLWSSAVAMAIAMNGVILAYWPGLVFLLPAAVMGLLALVGGGRRLWPPVEHASEQSLPADSSSEASLERTLVALWRSRILLPGLYAVAFAVNVLLPYHPMIKGQAVVWATVLGSVWMAARFAGFWWLGRTAWWHDRPGLLLWAGVVVIPVSSLILYPPVNLFPMLAQHGWLQISLLVCFQTVLGLCFALVYSASLYFGMRVSDGSTEHGGYHEAVVGAGMAAGPMLAWLSLAAGVSAVPGLALLLAVLVLVAWRWR